MGFQGRLLSLKSGEFQAGPGQADAFAVCRRDLQDYGPTIHVARFDALGNRLGEEIALTESDRSAGAPAIVWTGSEDALAWTDDRSGTWQVDSTRPDPDGSPIGGDVAVTDASINAVTPGIVRTGSGDVATAEGEDGVGWLSQVDNPSCTYPEIYLTRLSCHCPDTDDGFSACRECNDADPSVFPRAPQRCDGIDVDDPLVAGIMPAPALAGAHPTAASSSHAQDGDRGRHLTPAPR